MDIKTRIPLNEKYVALVGKTIYIFSYYEWIIIYIINHFEQDFVNILSRKKDFTSGKIHNEFARVVGNQSLPVRTIIGDNLRNCCSEFDKMIKKRNALIHAHPVTNINGDQILAYQGKPSKTIANMKWAVDDLEIFIIELDNAAIEALSILDELRKN
jgi:hypothetical protein